MHEHPFRGLRTTSLTLAAAVAIGAAACGGPSSGGLDASRAVEVRDARGASLGSVAFDVSCGEAAATEMRIGLALLHNMTFTQAERAFTRAAEAEPGCAMAYWGQAMTYVHPLWPDVPSDVELDRGWELLRTAREHGLPTAREEAYVAALEAYYRDGRSRSETDRIATYAEAWTSVRAEHPGDPEAALFASLSMIATAPAGDPTFQRQIEAGSLAESVLAVIPDHPGAHHYVIHAFDVPTLAERALPVARSYGGVAPANSHALHMTSHIFTRRGLWDESIEFNRRAADAAWEEPIGDRISHHHLHAVDYLAYAHLQQGADDLAAEVLEHVRGLAGPVMDNAASAYAFAAVPTRLVLERRAWSEAAGLTPRAPATIGWDAYPHLEAIVVFGRALGAAHTGELGAARRSADRLGELRAAAAELPGAYDWGTQVEVQEIGARAWIAYAEGNADEALTLMRRAADLEATTVKNPVTPGEVLPAGELLGDMLRELGRYEEAIEAYSAALERSRNRFNSLYGLGRAAEAMGDRELARDYYRELLEVAAPRATRRGPLDHADALVTEG